MTMDNDEKVLQLVKEKGPLLPIHIVKELGGNTILIGAVLSTLSERGLVKVSCAKIGGSPLYYVSGQEAKLDVLYKYLHEKEQKTYNFLKEKKVIRDISSDPVTRVTLRAIKDFAKPLEVNIKGNTEIFWKWYLTANSEVEPLIREQLKLSGELKSEKKPKEKEGKLEEESKGKKIKEEVKEKIEEREEETPEEEKEITDESKKEKPKDSKKGRDTFLEHLNEYFKSNKIEVVEKIFSKSREADFLIRVPSAIGYSAFYCKAKDKKTINEGDLSTAYVQGETKKMPVLFLTTGEPTKKAKEMLAREFRNFIIKKIE